eukprot:TRINITY_DN4814_c0_g1_i7.p4 TRINITY_DN4814_c0_g1~~TRINITY_DN4814_c0_g1_i7.p4  ORF type:complete len:157 (+),score=10.67 TRINITY_DN4814_c0_g1_i7:464-934(+)
MYPHDGGVPRRPRLQRGTVASIGEAPTIRCHRNGDIIRFSYRVVKRRSFERRHYFQVGDVVRYRLSPQPSTTADGLTVHKAEQVWVISPIRAAPAAAVVDNPAPMPAEGPALEALPVAVLVADLPAVATQYCRHDPCRSRSPPPPPVWRLALEAGG